MNLSPTQSCIAVNITSNYRQGKAAVTFLSENLAIVVFVLYKCLKLCVCVPVFKYDLPLNSLSCWWQSNVLFIGFIGTLLNSASTMLHFCHAHHMISVHFLYPGTHARTHAHTHTHTRTVAYTSSLHAGMYVHILGPQLPRLVSGFGGSE